MTVTSHTDTNGGSSVAMNRLVDTTLMFGKVFSLENRKMPTVSRTQEVNTGLCLWSQVRLISLFKVTSKRFQELVSFCPNRSQKVPLSVVNS